MSWSIKSERVASPAPGDIIDGCLVGVPTYLRVTHVRALSGAERTVAHLVCDIGHKRARKVVTRLNRTVQRLAVMWAVEGGHVSVHLGGLSGRPDPYTIGSGELTATVWLTVGRQIQHEIVVRCSSGMTVWIDATGAGLDMPHWWRVWRRTDCTLRSLRSARLRTQEAA